MLPIAPQVNAQNVNVLTLGEVEQGNANNANTGQASQQENSASAGATRRPAPTETCGSCGSKPAVTSQKNTSGQKQVQVLPIAPQVNAQNVNVLTLGEVEQGNANNANTGQASQQENSARMSSGCNTGCRPGPCRTHCYPKPAPSQCHWHCHPAPCHAHCHPTRCHAHCHPAPCHLHCHAKPAPRPCECQAQPTERPPCGCQPSWMTCGCEPKDSRQENVSSQRQIQILPIAPQLNLQNVNVLAFGDVEQGDANNANTGQASQQVNTWRGVENAGRPPVLR